MALDILYFAWVREGIGMGAERVDPPPGVVTVADLIAWLATRGPGHAAMLAEPGRLRAATNQIFVSLDTPLGAAREVAIFPPVTGG
ncbi:molybdopterin converting factor subunit 1 [uncultured Sphingomonas sp.]|uniref:molybdopterin converting factor subunit 1 n=1 Tax=uncultured Sphingomonas sp. TaxID=158754 RepID=UPI0035CAA374